MTALTAPVMRPKLPAEPVIRRAERGWVLEAAIFLPRPVESIFPFFADAGNLERITPRHLQFHVITPRPIEMRAGAIIDYRLKIRGLPFRWRSEITAWEPMVRFVDEQRRGPYRWWIHEHTFESVPGGTIARDVVQYGVPFGAIAHTLLVRRDVMSIFAYRTKVLQDLFGAPE
jgi:ligand-binding SRPBCC domain-containing protein